MLSYRAPRGTQDILSEEIAFLRWIEQIVRNQMELFGYHEIVTPTFEATELFRRSIGEGTDIVGKEMYTFLDNGGRSLTLRPEGTASVARAYLERGLGAKMPLQKLFYIGPMYRQESPQAGRLRQFNSFGVEAIGSPDPALDAEIILLFTSIARELGINDSNLRIGSIGCRICRPAHRAEFLNFLEGRVDRLCENCQRRYKVNLLRILDCKEETCRLLTADAPSVLDYLCSECSEHFEALRGYLEALGISCEIDRRLVRGFDYYSKTVFEVTSSSLGAQDAICGGGRYDYLIEDLGGNPTPGIGFGAGIERIIIALRKKDGFEPPKEPTADVYVACVGSDAKLAGVRLVADLRRQGISSEFDYLSRSLKSQMKEANRSGAKYALIIGDEEMKRGVIQLRDMSNSQQREIDFKSAVEMLNNLIKQT